jgi:predicted nuclease of predicted toxin-antitoxin system
MKIKLDENLPSELVGVLTALGHDVDTVVEEGLAGRDDGTVWLAAQHAARLLVTQDLDFSDIRKFQPGTHCGIILVRLRDPSRAALIARVRGLFELRPVQDWAGCFVVATEHRLRVRRAT